MNPISKRCSSIFFQQFRNINYVTPPFLAGKSVLSAKQFDREAVENVLKSAKRMQEIVESKGCDTELNGKVLLNVFMEPSTRTSSSFQTAMLRLGGSVVSVNESSSSVKKGETLEDTMKVIESYADVVVLRHPEIGSADRAASCVSIPVINAGDGPGEHPTQALLDCTCINGELKRLDGLTVTFIGDIKYGRTVHSLSMLLKHFDVNINFVSSDNLRAGEGFLNKLNEAGVKYNQYNLRQLNEVLPSTDVLYCTRIQQERFPSKEEYEKEKGLYIISTELLNQHRSKENLIVLHPLPRVDEIVPAFDNDPRACYFKQVRYGVYARMALLSEVLRKA